MWTIRSIAQDHDASCIVIDPLTALTSFVTRRTAPGVTERLIDWAKADGRTLVCTGLLDSPEELLEAPLFQISTTGCWRRRLAVLAITTNLLTGCGTEGSEEVGPVTCRPVVEYSREVQACAVVEVNSLPDGPAIAKMLSEYTVMRDQARACL